MTAFAQYGYVFEWADNISEKNHYMGGRIPSESRKKMKTKLYRVETTFLGADKSSKFYFDEALKAEDFLEKECQNGTIEHVGIISEDRLNYSDGCTWNELTCDKDRKPKEVTLVNEGWHETRALGDVYLDEWGKVQWTTTDDGQKTLYPYRAHMIQDGFGSWKQDGWDECSGCYTPAYLSRLFRNNKAIWS